MGKPRRRAVDILGLQHQPGRYGSRASGRTSKETIANGGRPAVSGGRSIPHELANLNHGGNERSHRHRVRRNWFSWPPHRSASALSRISCSDRFKASGRFFWPTSSPLFQGRERSLTGRAGIAVPPPTPPFRVALL